MKPSLIRGWDTPKGAYTQAHEEDGLVKLVIEFFNGCNLSCDGCFTNRVEGTWTEKGKSRLVSELPYGDQLALIEEAAGMGAKTVDIVGAGEPTLDPNFEPLIDQILNNGMHAVVFTHGATHQFTRFAKKYQNRDVTFFLKLWSLNPELQNEYVRGSVGNYAEQRDGALILLQDLGYANGQAIEIDGLQYRTTRIGADILVRKSNFAEIPDIFRFCRQTNVMPEIKTYLPEGLTRFSHGLVQEIYSADELRQLRKDEVEPREFQELRQEIVRIDQEEFGNPSLNVVYPQGCKCTQSMGAIYVTINGDIRSCVGSHISYGKYVPSENNLGNALLKRKDLERVGFGCVPRLEDADQRELKIEPELAKIYSDGIR